MSLEVPAACTLPTAEQPLRLAEFDELYATAVQAVDVIAPTRTRMRLTGPAGLEAQVRDRDDAVTAEHLGLSGARLLRARGCLAAHGLPHRPAAAGRRGSRAARSRTPPKRLSVTGVLRMPPRVPYAMVP